MTNKQDEFIFMHESFDGTETICKFNQEYTDKIVENFIQFLRGCGHYDTCIYTALALLVEEYYQSQPDDQASVSEDYKELLKAFREKTVELEPV